MINEFKTKVFYNLHENAYSNQEYMTLDEQFQPIHVNCDFFTTHNQLKHFKTPTRTQNLLQIKTQIDDNNVEVLNESDSSNGTMIIRKSPAYESRQNISIDDEIHAHISPPLQRLPSIRRSIPFFNYKSINNYENDELLQVPQLPPPPPPPPAIPPKKFDIKNIENLYKRKINSISPIMTSSRADLHVLSDHTNKIHLKEERAKIIRTPLTLGQQPLILTSKSITRQTPMHHENNHLTLQKRVNFSIDDDEDNSFTSNAYSNETYGIVLDNNNENELDLFVECNKSRFDRLKTKRKSFNHINLNSIGSTNSTSSSNSTSGFCDSRRNPWIV
jgi:hypothetical protein